MRMLFHYPGPFFESPATGEQRRPPEMCRAFEALGIEVHRIIGNAAERRARFAAVKDELAAFDLVYSENSTLPLRMVEPNHFPLLPSPDYALLRTAARCNLPVGVFYRDVHWRRAGFPAQIGRLKYALACPFYRSELRLYQKTATILYMPSKRVGRMLPGFQRFRIEELPPGGNPRDVPENPDKATLKLVYVGNVKPPVYNVKPLVRAVGELTAFNVTLEMAVPEKTAPLAFDDAPPPGNVRVHTATGAAVRDVYAGKDIATLFVPHSKYASDTVYVKLFEAVGFGLPVIGFKGTRCGEWIESEGLGWVVEPSDLTNLLRRLAADRSEVERKSAEVKVVRERHSWQARARQVVAELIKPD